MFERKYSFLFSIILFFVLGFFIGNFLGKSQCKICPPEEIDFSLFWKVYNELKANFVDSIKIDSKKITHGAISGMVKSLQDPYTVFLPPEESKRFQEDTEGKFEGVGMEIGMRKGQLEVIAPLEGTPAQKAGLRSGDKILAIDGKLVSDLTIDEAVNLIRGRKGTEVTLTIFRDDWDKTKEVKIIRDVIFVPSLKWELKENDIAYIKIYQFLRKTSSDFRLISAEILNTPAKKIILDLRNNPGGYLDIAQDIAGWFLEKGNVVVIEEFSNNLRNEYKADGRATFSKYPIVVLINEGSASASEILAGALKDNRGALLIGEKTFGKGSVQKLIDLKEGSLKVTIAKWLTPAGKVINEIGLEPDIKVEISDKDYEEKKDPQLEKALEIIKKM